MGYTFEPGEAEVEELLRLAEEADQADDAARQRVPEDFSIPEARSRRSRPVPPINPDGRGPNPGRTAGASSEMKLDNLSGEGDAIRTLGLTT